MLFIRDHRAWQKWRKKVFQLQSVQPKEPTKYPCWVYLTTRSYGLEEDMENYVYKEDAQTFLDAFTEFENEHKEKAGDEAVVLDHGGRLPVAGVPGIGEGRPEEKQDE